MADTQMQRIEKYLESHEWISQREAFLMGIYRLGARIANFKAAGYEVITEYRQVRNRDGSKSRVAYYKLGGKK
jgi:hypothetical protein